MQVQSIDSWDFKMLSGNVKLFHKYQQSTFNRLVGGNKMNSRKLSKWSKFLHQSQEIVHYGALTTQQLKFHQ